VRLREALSALVPLAFGALHVRLVHGWREQVGGYRDAALRFSIPHDGLESSGGWRELRDEINGRAEPLQRARRRATPVRGFGRKELLPAGRAEDCADEYGQVAYAIRKLMGPYVDVSTREKIFAKDWAGGRFRRRAAGDTLPRWAPRSPASVRSRPVPWWRPSPR
jgi:hypothetical protein